MTTEQFNRAKKYPFIFVDESNLIISLKSVGDYLSIVRICDDSDLKVLGLENYKEDIKYILRDIKRERKFKLNKIKESL